MAAINVSVGGNTRQLERDIQKTVNKAYNINLKTKAGQPLGRITGQVNEFTKSLDASNARVIAFGASAGIIFGVQRALGAVASSAVEVQKSLQDINVILNVSVSQLNKFGSELFNIAKNTGQSFGEVAKAATEFSRQGLGVEETLKRTNQALILSRLSGLDAAKSVQTLTAAVNSYASQAVTASEVVNKFANVDAAFAVSSADLADALARVGSSAAQSGVSLNELIAIVTAAQQTTARGGAVIGNSFKTIFTRLQRGKVVDLLENLGINTKDGSGQIKSTIQLLQDLAKTYDQLGTLQQAEVAEKVGGVFQINILKAALADLGKEYSIYNSALGVAASTTDQAIRRNEELNQTYAAQINVLKENAKQLASSAGQRLVGPAFERVVGGANKVLGGINDNEGNDYGSVLGKGILDGLAQVIAGPGLALLGGIFAKLFADLSRFAVGSAKDFLGLNNAAKQQAELQRSITDILSRNPALIQQMGQGTAGVNKLAETLLATLRAQTIELQKQQQVGAQVASILAKSGVRVKEGVPIATTTGKPGKAAGYIPNFAGGVSKRDGFAETVAAYQAGYEPGPVSRVDGKVYNKAESVVKFPGAKDRGIVPPKDSPAGKQYQKDFKKTANYDPYEYMETGMAKGFIPNFAFYKKYEPSKENIEKGIIGEAKTAEELKKRVTSGQLSSFKQESAKDPYASFDFRAVLPTGEELLIDAKNFQKFGRSKYLGEVTKKLWNFKQFNDLQTQTLDYTKTPVEIFIPKNTYEKSKSLKGLQRERLFNEGLGSLKGSGIKQYGSADRIKFKSRIKTFGEGFIPNFAQTKEPPIQLGNLDTIPNKLGKKVLSLIYPGISEGYILRPATASYLKKQYTGNIPVAGISQTKLKSQLPDIDKNIGNLLVKEANQFGQALGGFNFLKSPEELPNYGAAKGAVGVAFEGGVQTLLQQKIGKQNAGIDFRNVTPRLRSIFNNAPGAYDAKRSPELTNEVLQKLLNETKPGATVQKRSGQAGKDYIAQRSAAVNQLRKEGITGSADINRALKDRFGIVGKANGYIPNFAALQDAVGRERAAGIPSGKIYVAQDKRLAASGYNPFGLGVFNTRDEPNSGARSKAIKSRGYSSGYIPNFVQEDTAPADLTASIGAVVTQLGFVAFALSGFGNQYKQSVQELIATNREGAREAIRDLRARKTAGEQITRAQIKEAADKRKTGTFVGGGRGFSGGKFGAGISAGGAGLAIGAPIIAQTIANAIGKETKNARIGSAAASAFGDIGGFAGTGALVAGPKGAAVGALIGALTGLTGVIKQLSTDIPELSAKARESASNLTQFNEASQRTKTAFEQLQGLRSQGQAVEAGKAEGELLKNIQKDFAKNPELRAQATSAVINRDFAGLQQALDRNSEALLKLDLKQQGNLSVGRYLEQVDPKNVGRLEYNNQVSYTSEDLEKINKEFKEQVLPYSPINDRRYDTGLEPDKNENRKFLEETRESIGGLITKFKETGAIDRESRSKFLDKVQPNLDLGQKEKFLDMPDKDFLTKAVRPYATAVYEATKEWELIDKNTGRFNEEVQKVLQNIGDVRSSFDSFAKSADFALALQTDFNNALSAAKTALESAKLGNFADIATQLGDTSAGRRYNAQASFMENEQKRNETINTAFSGVERALTDYLIQQTKKTQEGVRTTPDTSGGEDPLKIAQKAQDELRSSIETLAKQFASVNLKPGDSDVDPLKTVEENLKNIFDKLEIPEPQQAELREKLREPLQNLLRESVLANTLLKQQNALIAEQKVGEVMKEFINAAQSALGGKQRFTETNLTFLNPFLQAIGDLIKLGEGPQGREVDIEQGRASLKLLDEISRIIGRNIIPGLGDDNPLKQTAIEGLSLDIFDQLKTVFEEFKRLPKEVIGNLPTDILKTLGTQVGIKEEDIDAKIASGNIDKLIDTIADKLAAIQVGGKVDDEALQKIRDTSIDQLVKEGSISAETANNIKNGLQQSVSTEALMVIKMTEQNAILTKILEKLPGGDPNSNTTFDLNSPLPTLSKGFVPSFAKEMNSVRRGVGGAKGTDYPLFVPNLNGEGAWINSGEKLIPNFANTGETAVLTRDMQKAMNMAEGYIPKASPELLKKFLEVVDDPEEFKKMLAPFQDNFYMYGRSFEQDAKSFNAGEKVDIGTFGRLKKKFDKFSWKELEELGLIKTKEIPAYRMAPAKIEFSPMGNYQEIIDDLIPKAREITAPKPVVKPSAEIPKPLVKPEIPKPVVKPSAEIPKPVVKPSAEIPKPVVKPSAEIPKPVVKPSAEIPKVVESTFPSQKRLPIPDSVKKEQIRAMVKYAEEQQTKINTPKTGQKSTSAAAKQVVKKGATKTILRALPGIGAILGLGEGAYRAFQGDYTGAALAAGAGLAGLKPGVGSGLSLALSAALIARDLQAAQDQISADQVLGTNKQLSETQLNTLLDAGKRLQTPSEFSLDDLDGTKKLLDQFIKNPNGLMRSNKPVYETIKSSVEEYLKNPAKTPSGKLGKEIQKAFNAKDPESMKAWINSLGLDNDVWDRIANRNGGWDEAINNRNLPMSIRMGLWNRQDRGFGTSIPRTGQVLTIGYVNGSEQKPLGYRDAAEAAGAEFQADGRLIFPGRDMAREINYVKPDGTVLHYKRGRIRLDKNGNNMGAALELQSITRPPNQEYVTEGTSNDIIGVKNGNTTEYFSTADAPLGGLGEYKGKKITDDKGGAVIEDPEGNIVGSIKSWQNDPAVKKAIETGNISEIEKATKQARDTAYANRGEIYGSPSVIDTIAGTPPKNKASQDFNNFLFEQKNKKYVDGVAADLVEPKPSEKPAPPPQPKKETTPEKIDEDIKNAKTKARGYIPSFTKEMRDISKGVGGARPTDTPLFIPNLNGGPAVINSGEKLIPNFAGSGETAVLTREMQKMMSFAKGFVPNFYQMGRTYSSRDKLFEARSGVDLLRGRRIGLQTRPSRFGLPPGAGGIFNKGSNTSPSKLSTPVKNQQNVPDRTFDNSVAFPNQRRFSDKRGLVDNAWQRIARRYYDRNLLQANLSYKEFEPLYLKYNSQENSNSYLTTRTASRRNNRLPMAIQMGLFNRAPTEPGVSKGLGRGIPAKNYFNRTKDDGRQFSYINGRLSSVTRPRNERYVSEGTNNDTIALQRNKNVTEYYGSQGSTLGGLGGYSGRKIEESIPFARGPIQTQQENISKNPLGLKGVSPVDFIRGKLAPDTFQNKFMSQISDTIGYQKFLQDDPLKLTSEPQQNFVRKTSIEDQYGKTVGTGTDLSFDSEVRKAVATGNIYEIEKATGAARDRISSRKDRLAKMSPEDQDLFKQNYFLQDLADKAGGLATGGNNQAEIDAYYKKIAEESGMGDRFVTDYIEPRERQIVREEQMKPINEARRSMNQADQVIKETDAYLMSNQPSEQYLQDRQQFIKTPSQTYIEPPAPVPTSQPTVITNKEEEKNRYAKGYIPNFAIDPMAITEAKLREKREAGPGSIPTFAMYNGKPMVYDARSQTPSSAIKDHAFEGGYEGVVKRQFGNISKKNLVANMSMPQEIMSKQNQNINNSNSPVFNINFNPQTTYSSSQNNKIPNFANVTKKYDAMIEDMRGNLRTIWDKYSAMENITNSNLREGNLKSAPPRTKRTLQPINIT